MTLPTTIFLYIATAVSVAAFFIYFLDKCLAKAGAWRVPEKVLLSLSVLFGGVGGLASMLLFRHKTKHWYFYLANILGILLTLGVGAICEYLGGGDIF